MANEAGQKTLQKYLLYFKCIDEEKDGYQVFHHRRE